MLRLRAPRLTSPFLSNLFYLIDSSSLPPDVRVQFEFKCSYLLVDGDRCVCTTCVLSCVFARIIINQSVDSLIARLAQYRNVHTRP